MYSHKQIYLDYAAATPVDRRVSRLVFELSGKFYGNPSSAHGFGLAAKEVLEKARKKIAAILAVKAEEIFFTGSGTESDNLAILGVARANKHKGRHIITSNIEHLAVLNACRKLEEEGFEVTYLSADSNGLVDPSLAQKFLRKTTILVSIMHANNEIGAIQPIKKISEAMSEFRPIFHSDACQSAGFLNICPHTLGVDLLSFNSSKIYGSKGIGCLYKKSGIDLESFFSGGSQEKGLRAGTENSALAAGLALALETAEEKKKEEGRRLTDLRDWFIGKIMVEIPDAKLNGDRKKRLPNNINISFKDVNGEMLMLALAQKGIAVSTGSACTSSNAGTSHVIKAIGDSLRQPADGGKKWGNLRISLGRETTKRDLAYFLNILKKETSRLAML